MPNEKMKSKQGGSMSQQNGMLVSCSLFTKLFLAKEAQLFKQDLNSHVNTVVNQYFSGRPLSAAELALMGFSVNPILKDQQSDFPFEPGMDLEVKFAEYQEWERKRLLEKALHQHVLLQLCNKQVLDPHMQIAMEILEDLTASSE